MNKKNKIYLLVFMIVLLVSCKMDKQKQMDIFLQALEKAREDDYKAALEILEKNIKKRDRGYHYYFYHGRFIEAQNYKKILHRHWRIIIKRIKSIRILLI